MQGDAASVQEQLPELVHQLWYSWHAALWDCSRRPYGPSGVMHSSLSGLVVTVLSGSRKSSLATRTTKSLQLRLAARHLSKCVFWSTHSLCSILDLYDKLCDVMRETLLLY